jgi:hypothetical protein
MNVGPKDSIEVLGIADASWASGADRKSVSGGVLMINGMLLESFSKTQVSIAQSTCEAELVALNAVACEAKAIAALLTEIGEIDVKIRLLCDSSSAILLMNKVGPGRLRHVETRKLWLQQEVESRRITIEHVPGIDNVADMLTKPLSGVRHRTLSWLIGLR